MILNRLVDEEGEGRASREGSLVGDGPVAGDGSQGPQQVDEEQETEGGGTAGTGSAPAGAVDEVADPPEMEIEETGIAGMEEVRAGTEEVGAGTVEEKGKGKAVETGGSDAGRSLDEGTEETREEARGRSRSQASGSVVKKRQGPRMTVGGSKSAKGKQEVEDVAKFGTRIEGRELVSDPYDVFPS